MAYYYAQLDENDIVIALSCIGGEETADNLIPITMEQCDNQELLLMKYNRETKEFEVVDEIIDELEE